MYLESLGMGGELGIDIWCHLSDCQTTVFLGYSDFLKKKQKQSYKPELWGGRAYL